MNEIKILIVEDNPIIAMDIKNSVNKFGFSVSNMVSNENDVFTSIKDNEPNLIIMDISLNSEKDGIDIVKEIHKTKYIPIIYLTGLEDDEIINRAIQTNPVGYLTKPFNRTELKSTIKLGLLKDQSNIKFKDEKYKYLGFDYYFDMKNSILYYKGQIQKLSENETRLLYLLINTNGELVTFETIENEVWEGQAVTQDAIRLLVSRLRKKLKTELIETIYSYGFKLNKNL